MATKRKPAELPETDNTALDLADVYEGEQLNSALERVFAEAGIEDSVPATVYVSKILSDSGKEARVWQGAPADYDLMALAKRHGSGDYRVKIYVQHTTGRMVFRGGNVFSILLDPAEDARIEAQRSGVVAQPAPQALDPATLARIIADAMRANAPQVVAAPAVNPLDMLKAVTEVARSLVPAASVAPANPLAALKDAVELVGLVRGNGGSDTPLEKGVNAGPYDMIVSLIDRFAPAYMALAAQGAAPGMAALPNPASGTTAGTATSGTIAGGVQATPLAQPSGDDEVNMRMKFGIAFLIQQCEAGGHPGTYAEVVADSVPPEALKQFIERADWIDFLAGYDVRVKSHVDWFTQLREETKALLAEPDQEVPTPPA